MENEDLDVLLRNSGWYPGRNRDIGALVQEMEAKGLSVHAKAREVLREYVGIEIVYAAASYRPDLASDPRLTKYTRSITFEPQSLLSADYCAAVNQQWRDVAQERLCPIGEAASGYLVMLIGESGTVYGEYADLYVLGRDIREALRCAISNDPKAVKLGRATGGAGVGDMQT